jgi:hypothetical protein
MKQTTFAAVKNSIGAKVLIEKKDHSEKKELIIAKKNGLVLFRSTNRPDVYCDINESDDLKFNIYLLN